MFHPIDLSTVDVTQWGEHATIEVCDGCKGGEVDHPEVAKLYRIPHLTYAVLTAFRELGIDSPMRRLCSCLR